MADDNIGLKMWAERKAEQEASAERRRELEKLLHDERLEGSPRYMRANQFARQVLALLQDYIPDACIRDAN